MTSFDQPEPRIVPQRRGSFLAPFFTLVVGVLVGLIAFAVFAYSSHTGFWSDLAGSLTGRRASIDLSSPAVVDRIHQLSRLETVVYTLDKVVEGDHNSPLLPEVLAGDKLLLVAHGDVIAGVDLTLLKPEDVQVSGDTVHVRLPAPQVLTTRLDNAQTKVYSRSTGLFVAADPNLETQVRVAAEQQITQAALNDGILDKAKQNAKTSLTALLFALGFHTVDVQ